MEARLAFQKGYNFFDLDIVDIGGFLTFPPDSINEREQSDKTLQKLLGKHVGDSKRELKEVMDRKVKCGPTTPYLTYQDKVLQEAKNIVNKMKNGNENGDDIIKRLETDFEAYRQKVQKENTPQLIDEEEKRVIKAKAEAQKKNVVTK